MLLRQEITAEWRVNVKQPGKLAELYKHTGTEYVLFSFPSGKKSTMTDPLNQGSPKLVLGGPASCML